MEPRKCYDDRPQAQGHGPVNECNGPCRETAATRIGHLVECARAKLAQLEALGKVAAIAEVGSPLELALYHASFGGDFR